MASILDRLDGHGLRRRVILDERLEQFLAALLIDPATAQLGAHPETGNVTIGYVGKPLGFFDLNFKAPVPDVPFRLELVGSPPTEFSCYLKLSETQPVAPAFDFLAAVPGYALTGATVQVAGSTARLVAAGDVRLEGANLSLLVRGKAGGVADMILTPASGGPDGIVRLAFVPDAVLLGGSGLGLRLPDGVVVDFTSSEKAPGASVIAGAPLQTDADQDQWQGVVARTAQLFLPPAVPLFSEQPIETALAIGQQPTPGIDLVVATRVPADGKRPEIRLRIECRDPTTTGIDGLLPTLIDAEMDLPLDASSAAVDNSAIHFLAGTPVVARLRLARLPAASPPAMIASLAIEAQGEQGILTIDAAAGGIPERAALAAGVLATALIADGRVGKQTAPGGDASGVYLHLLLTVAMGLSAFLKQQGKLVLHKVELEAEGEGFVPTRSFALRIDYSVDALVDTFGVGALSVGMEPNQPMRVRVRDVTLRIDTTKSGLEMIHLDFDRADLELEDPGGWKVQGPGSLFDILGTRSGRGSMWIEVDLRFALDLGPVKVSGATIRATLDSKGKLSAELRGLDASLTLPGVVTGTGRVAIESDGFKAALGVSIIPLNLAAKASVAVKKPMIAMSLGIDLPGPIPIANSGLGLFGIKGDFAANGSPKLPPAGDIVTRQLAWNSDPDADGFGPDPGNSTLGFEAVIGTAPDMAFTMSAKGGLFITLPDVAVRAGLSARLFSPRLKVTERPPSPGTGISFRGVGVFDQDGATIGLEGSYLIPHLIDIKVPFGAHFPKGTNDWFLYLGADGATIQDRGIGPVRARVLPDLVDNKADAFLMLRGQSLLQFGPAKQNYDGFVIACGFGFEYVMGLRHVIWAEISASAAIVLATDPLLFAGYGRIDGSLHLGPVSIGVGASLRFKRVEGQDDYIFAQVCGSVDLFFFELEGCVEISIGSEHKSTVPLPTQHPLERREGDSFVANVALVDDHYCQIASLSEDATKAATVWPDTIILLSFGVPPALAPGCADQFPDVEKTYGPRARPFGSDLLSYQWTLESLQLVDCTNGDPMAGTPVAGEFSAAWQAGKFGDPGKSAEPCELALLTHEGTLWMHRAADGGTKGPYDPLPGRSKLCEPDFNPELGWALAYPARMAGANLQLVPEILKQNPCASRIKGVAVPGTSLLPSGARLDMTQAANLALPWLFDPASEAPFQTPFDAERSFDGYWSPGRIWSGLVPERADDRRHALQSLIIMLDDAIVQGRLWIVIDRNAAEQVTVEDGQANWIGSIEGDPNAGDLVAVRFKPTAPTPVDRLIIAWPVGARFGLMGVGGMTLAAAAAADAANAAAKATADTLAEAAKSPPTVITPSGKNRCVLEPGRTYRIDLEFSWSGTLIERDDKGVEHKIPGGGADYHPPNSGVRQSPRHFWFKTAPVASPLASLADVIAPLAVYGTYGHVDMIHRRQDIFNPAMLLRYFGGYNPAQTVLDRFRDDPLSAHFTVSHVIALAKAYGFTLELQLKRIDTPGNEGLPQILQDMAVTYITDPSFLAETGKVLAAAAVASRCEQPGQGLSLTAPAQLAGYCWYELALVARAADPQKVLDGQLPPVTFRTSRWAGPKEMMAALGFPATGQGASTGDLDISQAGQIAPASVLDDDAAFDAALAALGLDGLPPPRDPRVSLLWTRQPGSADWLLGGVLVECPEAIHRPGRLGIIDLKCNSGQRFDIRRRDRSGSRLLFATSAPFAPESFLEAGVTLQPALRLTMRDAKKIGKKIIAGELLLRSAPDFASEPL